MTNLLSTLPATFETSILNYGITEVFYNNNELHTTSVHGLPPSLIERLEREVKPKCLLSSLWELAYRAHTGTSFSPEKRADNIIQSYSEELVADIEELKKSEIEEEIINGYISRYKNNLSSWLSAKSNCLSTMIAGGSNFPVRRAEKANRSEQRNYEVFRVWREKAKKAIIRKSLPEKTFISEIDRYKKELEGCKRNQQLMKDTNAIIRKSKGKDCTSELIKLGLSEKIAVEIQKPDFCGRIGFASYSLTNNNANIKRLEERLKTMEQKEELSTTVKETEYKFSEGIIIMNFQDDRIQVKHDQKPNFEGLQTMKKHGFKWSPSNVCWQRQITVNAIYTTNSLFSVNIPRP